MRVCRGFAKKAGWEGLSDLRSHVEKTEWGADHQRNRNTRPRHRRTLAKRHVPSRDSAAPASLEYGPDLRCPELSQRKSGRDQIVTSSGTAYPVCFVSSAMGDRWNKRVLFEIGKTDVFAPGRSSDFPGSPAIFLYFNNHPFGIGSLDCRYDVPIDGAAAGTADRCG